MYEICLFVNKTVFLIYETYNSSKKETHTMLDREEIRQQYSLWTNLKRALTDMKIMGYRNYIYLVLDITTQIIVPFLLILIPAKVIQLLQKRVDLIQLLIEIIVWIGLVTVLNLIRTYSHHKFDRWVV